MAVPFETVLCYFPGHLQYSRCSSNIFISDIFFITVLVHLSILISFTSSRASCPFCIISGCFYHLLLGFISLRKEEPLPELFPQTPVSSYSWPRRIQVVDKVVSPSCLGLPCRLVRSVTLMVQLLSLNRAMQ